MLGLLPLFLFYLPSILDPWFRHTALTGIVSGSYAQSGRLGTLLLFIGWASQMTLPLYFIELIGAVSILLNGVIWKHRIMILCATWLFIALAFDAGTWFLIALHQFASSSFVF